MHRSHIQSLLSRNAVSQAGVHTPGRGQGTIHRQLHHNRLHYMAHGHMAVYSRKSDSGKGVASGKRLHSYGKIHDF